MCVPALRMCCLKQRGVCVDRGVWLGVCVCVCMFCLRECACMHVIFPRKREVSVGVLP